MVSIHCDCCPAYTLEHTNDKGTKTQLNSNPALRERAAVLEVIRSGDGRRMLRKLLEAPLKPPTEKSWQPLEFLASVGPAGLVAPLTLTVRSGVDEVDAHFRKFLSDTFRVGDQLTPGFYRITLAP